MQTISNLQRWVGLMGPLPILTLAFGGTQVDISVHRGGLHAAPTRNKRVVEITSLFFAETTYHTLYCLLLVSKRNQIAKNLPKYKSERINITLLRIDFSHE